MPFDPETGTTEEWVDHWKSVEAVEEYLERKDQEFSRQWGEMIAADPEAWERARGRRD